MMLNISITAKGDIIYRNQWLYMEGISKDNIEYLSKDNIEYHVLIIEVGESVLKRSYGLNFVKEVVLIYRERCR